MVSWLASFIGVVGNIVIRLVAALLIIAPEVAINNKGNNPSDYIISFYTLIMLF